MSGRVIVVRHDAALARWEIGEHPWVGRAASPDLAGTQVVEAAGRVREIVVDAEQPSDADLDTIRTAFGADVAETVRSHRAGEDLDVVVETSDPAVALDERPTSTIEHPDPLPGEPGRTTRGEDAAWAAADLSGHPAVVELEHPEVTVEHDGDEIVVSVRGLLVHGDVWVRVSAADSGSIVATSRLRPRSQNLGSGTAPDRRVSARSAVSEARMAYGIDLDPEHLHVSITDEPLATVGTLAERRRRWCDDLLDGAHRARRRHPGRALADATRATDVAVALGDHGRHRRATSLTTAIRRRRTAYRAIAVVVVLAAAAAAAWWIGGDRSPDGTQASDDAPAVGSVPDTDPDPGVTAPSISPHTTRTPVTTETPVTTPVPPTSSPTTATEGPPGTPASGFPGPTVYRFDNDESITITLAGRSARDARDTRIELTGRETFRGLMDYSTPENCRASLSVPAAGTTGTFPAPMEVVVRLVPVGGDTASRATTIVGTVRFDAELVETSVFPETCGTVGDLATGAWGEALFRRGTAPASVELDEPLAPGLWQLDIAGTDGRPTTPTPEPVVVRVVADD